MKIKAELWDKVQYIFRNYYDRMIHFAAYYEGSLDIEALRKSATFIVDRFPIFRSSFKSNTINPYWHVNEDFDSEEIVKSVLCDDLRKSVLNSLSKEIPFDGKYQFEITAHYCRGQSAISILVNHMCMDGSDYKYFIEKLIEGYNISLDGGDVASMDFKVGDRGYLQLYKDMSEEDAEKAKSLYKNISRTGIKNKFDFTDDEDCTTRFNFAKLSPQTLDSLKKKGKEHSATLNDIFITAYARAIQPLLAESDDKRIVITSMKNLRDKITSHQSDAMTNLTGFVPCVIDEIEGDFVSTLEVVAEKTRLAKDDKFCGLYGVPLLALAFRLFPYSISEFAIKLGYENPLVGMSNIGIIDEEKITPRGLKSFDAFMTGATKFKPYIQLTCTTFDNELTMCIAQKCSDEDERRIRLLLDGVVNQLNDFLQS